VQDFAIIAEGITDQIVIRELLFAYFADRDEPTVNFVQPDLDATQSKGVPEPGGWTLVLQYLREGRFLQALQTNRYVIIHIDTDIASDLGVPGGLANDEVVRSIIAKLQSAMGPQSDALEDRILYAIGVDSIECWLLHLVFDRSEKAKLNKFTGCLPAIDHALRKKGQGPLSTAGHKLPQAYQRIAAAWRKRSDIKTTNPGLAALVTRLETVSLGP